MNIMVPYQYLGLLFFLMSHFLPRVRARDTWLRPLMLSDTLIQLQWDSAVRRGHGHTAQRLLPDSRL